MVESYFSFIFTNIFSKLFAKSIIGRTFALEEQPAYLQQLKTKTMIAIVDCNSFYCSCERVFRPDLTNKPVVVLSNNDGCVVSRTDEAVALGITMAVPYFQVKELAERHKIEVFSSNYNLYGDMSRRVMETLRLLAGNDNVEVYSVDEAFVNLGEVQNVYDLCKSFKDTVEQWTGVKVSVGAAPTKVLAKMANRLAKKNKEKSGGIAILDTPGKIAYTLQHTEVKDVWGVGRRYAEKVQLYGITTAYDLSNKTEQWAHDHLGGVVGLRLLKELKGEPCIEMCKPLNSKKNIATTRMFGSPVSTLKDIKEAVATYTSIAATKLRRQQSAASMISVFVVIKLPASERNSYHGETLSHYFTLPYATSSTNHLIKVALALVQTIYKEGLLYNKAGVMLTGLVPDVSVQSNLFVPPVPNNNRSLMNVIDNINASMRDDKVKFAAAGIEKNWKMRQEKHSPRYTTRWSEMREVK